MAAPPRLLLLRRVKEEAELLLLLLPPPLPMLAVRAGEEERAGDVEDRAGDFGSDDDSNPWFAVTAGLGALLGSGFRFRAAAGVFAGDFAAEEAVAAASAAGCRGRGAGQNGAGDFP